MPVSFSIPKGDRGSQPPGVSSLYHFPLSGTGHLKGGLGRSPSLYFSKITYFVIFYRFSLFLLLAPIIVRGISCVVVPGFLFSYLNSNTGWRVLNVGGRYTNGLNAGLFQFNANNASSNSNANVGARLLVSYLRAQDLPHR